MRINILIFMAFHDYMESKKPPQDVVCKMDIPLMPKLPLD